MKTKELYPRSSAKTSGNALLVPDAYFKVVTENFAARNHITDESQTKQNFHFPMLKTFNLLIY